MRSFEIDNFFENTDRMHSGIVLLFKIRSKMFDTDYIQIQSFVTHSHENDHKIKPGHVYILSGPKDVQPYQFEEIKVKEVKI